MRTPSLAAAALLACAAPAWSVGMTARPGGRPASSISKPMSPAGVRAIQTFLRAGPGQSLLNSQPALKAVLDFDPNNTVYRQALGPLAAHLPASYGAVEFSIAYLQASAAAAPELAARVQNTLGRAEISERRRDAIALELGALSAYALYGDTIKPALRSVESARARLRAGEKAQEVAALLRAGIRDIGEEDLAVSAEQDAPRRPTLSRSGPRSLEPESRRRIEQAPAPGAKRAATAARIMSVAGALESGAAALWLIQGPLAQLPGGLQALGLLGIFGAALALLLPAMRNSAYLAMQLESGRAVFYRDSPAAFRLMGAGLGGAAGLGLGLAFLATPGYGLLAGLALGVLGAPTVAAAVGKIAGRGAENARVGEDEDRPGLVRSLAAASILPFALAAAVAGAMWTGSFAIAAALSVVSAIAAVLAATRSLFVRFNGAGAALLAGSAALFLLAAGYALARIF